MFAASPTPSFLRTSAPLPSPALNLRSQSLRASATSASSPPLSPTVRSNASPSLYEVLGLSVDATCHEIKGAYRRLVRTCHPDVVANDRKGTSANEFMRIHAAYSTLSDPEKRADYDRKILIRQHQPRFGRAASFGGHGRRTWETDQCW